MENYNYAVMRELIEAAFNDENLVIFCSDHFSEVSEQFTAGQNKRARIHLLIDHVRRHGLADRLLNGIQESNLYQYNLFENALNKKDAPKHRFEFALESNIIVPRAPLLNSPPLCSAWIAKSKPPDLAIRRERRGGDEFKKWCSREIALIRFIVALLQYAEKYIQAGSPKKYIEVPELVTREFQFLLEKLFDVNLRVIFPDSLSMDYYSEIRKLCKNEWEIFCTNYGKF